MNDLFLSKLDLLKDFCKDKHFVSKGELYEWAVKNKYISADRRVREMVEAGIMRSLSRDEIIMRGFFKKGTNKAHMAWYEWQAG